MRKIAMLTSAVVLWTGIVLAGGQDINAPAQANEQTIKPQTVCPVMGGAIDKNLYVDHQGRRIFVCCKMCIQEVQKDPAKYVKQLEEQGITLERSKTVQTTKTPSCH